MFFGIRVIMFIRYANFDRRYCKMKSTLDVNAAMRGNADEVPEWARYCGATAYVYAAVRLPAGTLRDRELDCAVGRLIGDLQCLQGLSGDGVRAFTSAFSAAARAVLDAGWPHVDEPAAGTIRRLAVMGGDIA